MTPIFFEKTKRFHHSITFLSEQLQESLGSIECAGTEQKGTWRILLVDG
jgi:hypothetical protein